MAAPTGVAAQAMKDLWARTVAGVKQETIQPGLFRAVEQSVVVTQEDGQFVIGFGGNDAQIGSLLRTSQYQVLIERILRREAGDPNLRLRVIDGTTYADWEHTQRSEAATVARQQQTIQKQVTETAKLGSWEDLYEQISRMWATTENRNIAIGRGQYLENALTLVSDGMDRLYPKEGKPDDLTQRGLSRVIERMASMTNSDAAVIAYLLLQRRKP